MSGPRSAAPDARAEADRRGRHAAACAAAAGRTSRRRRNSGPSPSAPGGAGSYLIVNGSETEPASGKDGLLLSRLPHLVLDGAVLAARRRRRPGDHRQGRRTGDRHAPRPAERARGPRRRGFRSTSSPGPRATSWARRARSSTSSAAALALPTFVPPRPFERGYRDRPTLIQNPETLAQIALVARYGHDWYRELGTAGRPRVGARHDLRRGRRARRLRARLRHAADRPARGRRRIDRAAPGAARRRLLRHLGRVLAGASSCGSPGRICARSAARSAPAC